MSDKDMTYLNIPSKLYFSLIDQQLYSLLLVFVGHYQLYILARDADQQELLQFVTEQMITITEVICKHFKRGRMALMAVKESGEAVHFTADFLEEVEFFTNHHETNDASHFEKDSVFLRRMKTLVKSHSITWPSE